LELRKLFITFADFPFAITQTNLDFVFSIRLLLILAFFDDCLADRNVDILFVVLVCFVFD